MSDGVLPGARRQGTDNHRLKQANRTPEALTTMVTRAKPPSYLTEQLNELKAKGTHFKLRVLDDEQAAVCTFDGKKVINLASNNYLGLTTHPKLRWKRRASSAWGRERCARLPER